MENEEILSGEPQVEIEKDEAKDEKANFEKDVEKEINLPSHDDSLDTHETKSFEKPLGIELLLCDEEFLEKNVYANKRICEEIIDRYIVSLKKGNPPRVMSSGGQGAPSIKTPTTLKEAKLLAEIMFSSND